MSDQKKIAFHTLGCKLNFSETSTLARMLDERNFTRVTFNDAADIYVINTCTVTDNADRKCRQAVKKAVKTSPGAYVVVLGCYSQLKPGEIAEIEGVDLILGTNEKFRLAEFLDNPVKKDTPIILSGNLSSTDEFSPSFSLGDRTRSFLKIQDGCDYFCSYCTIPLARGRSRSASVQSVIEEARKIAERNIKEIILTGVNIGDFGKTTGENFMQLIRELEHLNGIERFRISSIEPNLVSDEIIEFVSESAKFAPHFHIPLQSGCDKILALMKRKYQRELFTRRVEKIRSLMPDAGIGTDVIVGFPGETDEDFRETQNYLEAMELSYLHVFSYSERANTRSAHSEPKNSSNEIIKRSRILQELSRRKKRAFYHKSNETTSSVLFESQQNKGRIYGFTGNYIKAETDFDPALINKIVNVKLLRMNRAGNMECSTRI